MDPENHPVGEGLKRAAATMQSDVTDRLREVRCDREPFTPDHAKCVCRLANEAAEEIERLRIIEQRWMALALPRKTAS
jgi:hypothetical protein